MKKLYLSLLFALCNSCGHGPTIVTCVSFPPDGVFVCKDQDGQTKDIPFSETTGYVAFSPEDIKTLLNYCGIKGKTQQGALNFIGGIVESHNAISH